MAVLEEGGRVTAAVKIPQREKERGVYLAVREGGEMTAADMRERTGYTGSEIRSCIQRLRQAGLIEAVGRIGNGRHGKIWRAKI